jgi:hypothetical protein
MMKRISQSTTESVKEYLEMNSRQSEFKRIMSNLSQLETKKFKF